MTEHRMDDTDARGHPSDTALAAWVDERSEAGGIAAHLAACATCRGRVASLQQVVETLRAAPAPLDAATAAASRARILAGIGPHASVYPVRPARRSFRAVWWIPPAAAAGLALFFVLRDADRERAPVMETAASEPALPVVTAAEEAAAEVAIILDDASRGMETTEAAAAAADAEMAVLDAAAEPLPGAGIADFTVVEEFADLEPEDQEAVLMELAASDFEL